MMRTLLNRGFSQRSQMEVELLAIAWMLPGGNGGGMGSGDAERTQMHISLLLCIIEHGRCLCLSSAEASYV